MRPASQERARLQELLLDRAGGERLGGEDSALVERLLDQFPEEDPAAYDEAAAALHLALLRPALEPLPAPLRATLLAQGEAHLASIRKPERPGSHAHHAHEGQPRASALPASKPALPGPWLLGSGWLVAAAALVLLFLRSLGPAPAEPVDFESLVASAGARVAAWTPTEDPDGVGVTGEVVWSDRLQKGVMRFEGLPKNDPTQGQYQLWIFDATRSADHPVDGGVFDSTAAAFEVPIDAKIVVDEATLFAITYERPGGVVVSSRERLLLTAAVE